MMVKTEQIPRKAFLKNFGWEAQFTLHETRENKIKIVRFAALFGQTKNFSFLGCRPKDFDPGVFKIRQ